MKIAEFSVKNFQFTLIIFVLLLALGLNSLFNMPRGEDPEMQRRLLPRCRNPDPVDRRGTGNPAPGAQADR